MLSAEEVIESVSERTGGVPLYVEEVARLLLEHGEARRPAGDSADVATVARRATRPARRSARSRADQRGAGARFHLRSATSCRRVDDPALQSALDKLADADLLIADGAGHEANYRFKHALVKDAAYQSLLKSRRQQLHARVAQAFEDRFPAVVETQPELLAYHLTEAGLDARAADAWARAGRAALDRSAMREAANSLSRAVGLLRGMPSSPDQKRLELELLGALGVALTNTLGPASSEAQAAHERAAQLSQELGDREGRCSSREGP